jgi:hypothetical protein
MGSCDEKPRMRQQSDEDIEHGPIRSNLYEYQKDLDAHRHILRAHGAEIREPPKTRKRKEERIAIQGHEANSFFSRSTSQRPDAPTARVRIAESTLNTRLRNTRPER